MASTATYPPMPPSDPSNIQQTTTHGLSSSTPPSGTRVRTNGLHFIRTSWQNISRASKIMLVSTVLFILSQIAVSIAILVIYQNATCDKPLKTYLTIFVVRSGLLLPLLIYQYFTRPSFLQRQQQQQQELRERQIQNRYQLRIAAGGRSPSLSSASLSSSSPSPPPHGNTNSNGQGETASPTTTNNSGRNSPVKEWCERLKSLLDLFGILWFIVGNYLVFTSNDCPYLAGGLYYTIMTWVVLSYLVILLPIILCASVIFCLPCVLVVLRLLNINDIPGMKTGATQEEILTIPTYTYQSQEGSGTTETSAPSDTPQKPRSSNSWTKRMLNKFKKNDSDIEAKSYPPITISCADDAMCSICLSEYETGDLICKLWCDHHFHRDCVFEWLRLNSLCPLCKQNFRGREYNDNVDPSTEPDVAPSTS